MTVGQSLCHLSEIRETMLHLWKYNTSSEPGIKWNLAKYMSFKGEQYLGDQPEISLGIQWEILFCKGGRGGQRGKGRTLSVVTEANAHHL